MSKRDHLQSLARKVTGNNNLHCGTVKEALHCIAEKAAGESVKCTSICSALDTIEKNYENLIGGEPLKYHLYAWDYAGGAAIAYSEKEVPVAGDVVFLKEDMEGGKITDTNQLKLIYHVVSDADGVITVSEHPEGQTGGYTFNRNDADDYEETVTDVRDMVDITQNGFLMSQKGTVFKGVNVITEVTPDNPIAGVSWDDSETAWFFFVKYNDTFKSNMSKLITATQNPNMYLWDKTTQTKLDGGDLADDLYVADNKIIAGHELVATIFTNSTYDYQRAVTESAYAVPVTNPKD